MPSTTATRRTADKLVAVLFDIIDHCSWEELGEVFAEDCVYDRPGYESLIGLRRVQRFYRHERIVASGHHHVVSVVSDIEAAACWGRFLGTARSGQALDEDFADTYSITGGKIEYRKTFFFRPAM
jgi:ketosteroid isomerase-like protein